MVRNLLDRNEEFTWLLDSRFESSNETRQVDAEHMTEIDELQNVQPALAGFVLADK